MPRVLIADELSPQAAQIFTDRGVNADVKIGLSPDALIACIGDYQGLAIRSATKVTEKIIAAATNLKVIGRAGIGVDNVDIPAASRKGIVVMNTPFGNSITTAEHAITLMLACARQIPAADASTQAGKWEKSKFMGVEITNKYLGIIGAGNIGKIVIERAQGLKMKVLAYDPFLSHEKATEIGVEKVELDDMLARADGDLVRGARAFGGRGGAEPGDGQPMGAGRRPLISGREGDILAVVQPDHLVPGIAGRRACPPPLFLSHGAGRRRKGGRPCASHRGSHCWG